MKIKISVINDRGTYERVVSSVPKVGDLILDPSPDGDGKSVVVRQVVERPGEPICVETVRVSSDADLEEHAVAIGAFGLLVLSGIETLASVPFV